jgi:hypothetical protein
MKYLIKIHFNTDKMAQKSDKRFFNQKKTNFYAQIKNKC